MKIILINGSPNEKGCTYTALSECAEEFSRLGAETEIVWIGKKPMPGCIGCWKCSETGHCVFGGLTEETADKIVAADGMIVGSPVYFASVNGSLVSFLDRLYASRSGEFMHKPFAAVVSARRGGTTASLDVLNKYGLINEQPIVASQYWPMVHGNSPEEVKKDKEGLQIMRTLARNMHWLISCIDAGKKAGINTPNPEEAERTNFIR